MKRRSFFKSGVAAFLVGLFPFALVSRPKDVAKKNAISLAGCKAIFVFEDSDGNADIFCNGNHHKCNLNTISEKELNEMVAGY